MTGKTYVAALGTVAMIAVVGPACASDDWRYRVTPYLWLPTLNLTTSGPVGGVDVETEVLDVLHFAALLKGQATRGSWSIIGEANYLDLSEDGVPFIGLSTASVDLDGWMGALGVGYAVMDDGKTRVDVMGGARGWSLDVLSRIGPASQRADQNFIDPIIGMHLVTSFNDRWGFRGEFDYGGFGVGSQQQWNVVAEVTYAAWENTDVGFGWRHIHVKLDNDDLLPELTMTGPYATLSFKF